MLQQKVSKIWTKNAQTVLIRENSFVTQTLLNPKILQELVDFVNQAEEPVVEKTESLKDCLEVHKEPESKKYERRSLREDFGLTEKSEQKDDE